MSTNGLPDDLLALVAAIQDGLPLTPRPYAQLAERRGISEKALLDGVRDLVDSGIIKRYGLVVHHRALGYRSNAMVVWDVADEQVVAAGRALAALPFVTLCYRRPRRPPAWPYNLFCMIHGRDRGAVLDQVAEAAKLPELDGSQHATLFSTRRFKQRGARYATDKVAVPRSSRKVKVTV